MEEITLKIYFLACADQIKNRISAVIKQKFPNSIIISSVSSPEEINRPDIIFCGNSSADCATLKVKYPKCKIALLSENDCRWPECFDDIWLFPMRTEEIGYRFLKLRERCLKSIENEQNRVFLQSVLDASPNLIWFKHKDGRHILVNQSFCNAVNKTADDVHGKRHPYIWNVETEDPACIESERIVMDTQHTHISEETIQTGDGIRLLTTYKSPVNDRHGEIWGTVGIGVDITRERDFHKRLIDNNETLETIFTNMDCGILCHTLDGNHIISVNPAALELLGYQTREELEKGFHVLAASVIEGDRSRLISSIEDLKNVGDSANFEYRVILPDGQLRYMLGNAKIIEKDGRLICQRLILDSTAQKLAEEQAKTEKERHHRELVRALSVDYQLVMVFGLENGSDNILQLKETPDPVLKKIFANSASLETALAYYADQCVHPDDREIFKNGSSLKFLEKELDYEDIYYLNYRVLIENQIHYFQLKAVRAGTSDHPLGIVIGLQSVNERTRKDLEQRTALAIALKDARKASESKSRFLSNMSHDIRTPMNAVVGYTSLALSQLNNQIQVENYLGKILASGKHLLNLINDILDMSHIESGKLQLEDYLCSLPQILENLINIIQPVCDEKNQTVSLSFSNLKNPWVYCDRLRLNQVLLNLLGNSVKYTPPDGKIDVQLSEKNADTPERAIYEFRIKDNGIGMSEEFLSRIYEPFERAQTSTIAGIQGTGLGMTISRNLVKMMNGEIQVESKLNEGTEFILTIPFRLGIPENEEPAVQQLPKIDEKEKKSKNIRILLAEDNEMNQEIANEFLTGAGYSVDIANNGQEAIEKLSEAEDNYYSVILMDVQMPVMDGYKATEVIRSLPDPVLANIPIIALTANSFEEDKAEALNRGMTDHIAKPINFDILFNRLAALLAPKS